MHLTHRPVEHDDLPRCLEIIQDVLTLGTIDRRILPKLWVDFITRGAMIMSVVEDLERQAASRVMGFGSSVFVADRFIQEAKTWRAPDLSGQIIRDELGGKSPVLNAAAVRAANSGDGLNLFVLHYGWDIGNLEPDQARAVRDELIRAFLNEHRGYRLKEILIQRCGDEGVRRVLTGGFVLRRDFADYYQKNGSAAPPPDQHPYLAGLTREEAQMVEGSAIASLFLYTAPRFRFRQGEQELLRRALMGETDEELAVSLAVSPSAIKKRWASIFERSAAVMPDLLPRAGQPAGAERKRGAEKRRRLLAYLRHHPEDLRPVYAEPRASKGEEAEKPKQDSPEPAAD
ncbi:MAG TPA: hypothetical protein VFW40_13750 [Capsulimonadaceae bacterium]|nr:hypothetical protein [Capsulimonadaceae bacterium]